MRARISARVWMACCPTSQFRQFISVTSRYQRDRPLRTLLWSSDQMIDLTDFEELLDHANLGKAPTDHYKHRLDVLDNVVRECMHVSYGYGGIPAPPPRHFYASVLFTCLVTKGVSLLSLAP